MADLQEGFWDNLLDYIQDRSVVPVIGPELVTVREGEADVPLYRWLAQRLAADLELPSAELREGFDLNDIVALHLRRRGEREELYTLVHRLLRHAALTPPESLRALAGIPGFDLFVSLTFDSLLADALGAARPGGDPRAEQVAYAPSTVRDLACPKAELRQPVVFHLLGRASASPDYAICDEDLLEFLHAMQDKQRQPKTLFDELRGNHLLILGCNFEDWLARFFLRTARSLELSQKRRRWDVLVGDKIAHDARLALFLESFSADTRVVPWTAAQFVTRLAERWQAAHPAAAQGTEPVAPAATAGGRSIPAGAIFVSYASDDLAAASRLADGLRAAGLEVWFDKAALQPADAWARGIRRGIERCSLFLPLISRRAMSEENRRRYFWREWNDADDLARGMAPDEAYIVPVVIDDTRIDRAPLPDSFKRAQGAALPGGQLTPAVADLLREASCATSTAGSERLDMVGQERLGLSPDNPWPGLDPFDETDREYFHGRATESRELVRLVRREPLTVLFGRSGLGKTSLLKAGLFPLLHGEDCLPVYVRLDHAAGAPAPRAQIFRGLQAACDADRVQPAQAAGDESLWSFFHRRDAEFWSERNHPVTPVIVFDQFEEIFTLGQETAPSRDRSAAFLAELGDLVENRPPDAVRQALEAESTATRRFDFKRSTVKLVLSFREDFLAEMEGLKQRLPSLMYNRFRLLAMSGTQAYEVITRAGGHLVGDEVARRIIRLAWKNEPSPPVDAADFPNIEIDPALLSVVCSELNQKRQQAAPPLERITPALLEGADREILVGLYERSMAGLDPRLRSFVEDRLITGRGYRDSHALEDALSLPGVTAAALDVLIRHRLLRVDDRQSVRRLELTHDVLTRVVKESRDRRRAREAEAAAKAREREALEQQRRNRRNAALVLAGALVVIVLTVLAGWFSWQASRARARAAELVRQADRMRWVAAADQLQAADYAVSLLVNLEAVRIAPTTDTRAGLRRRFLSHPNLAAFLAGHKDHVLGVAVSPDGRRLASASRDQTVILWDVASRRRLATLAGHKGSVESVAFSPDGKRLASAGQDQTVILWDVESRRRLATLAGHKGSVQGVAFSPDGKRLASASEDQTVILWDVDSRRPLATLRGHKDEVYGVAFSPDGRRLASASRDQTVILWDVDGRQPLATLAGNKGTVYGVAFSPDGKRLASAGEDKAVTLWDVDSRRPLAALAGHQGTVFCVAFSRDGKRLATASSDQTVILWDLDSRKPLATLEGHKDWVESVTFIPDGLRLASASRDHAVILWDVDKSKPVAALEGHRDAVVGVAFSPDGKELASASEDKAVTLWDVDSRRPLATLVGHKDAVFAVAFSPDGKRLASASWDQTLILWDVESRKPLARLAAHFGPILGVAFSPDGKRLASASMDQSVILWDLDHRRPIDALEGHNDGVLGVAFSPDGKRLASASLDKTVILWDVDSRKPLARLAGHTDAVQGVAFSPDGKRLASAGWDRKVILWDMESRKQVATLAGHKNLVRSVAFSPDGKRLASASQDRTVILWDVASGRALATLEGHKGGVFGVAFSPDGMQLASASQDQTVILWETDLSALTAEACRTANRNLTCEEWRTYIDVDQPYHKTCAMLPGPETCD